MARLAITREHLIKEIRVSGFKSAIQETRLTLGSLTIIAGQNSAGKSTVLQPILLLKQTLEKPYDPGSLAIDGPLIKFTNADQFFSKKLKNREVSADNFALYLGNSKHFIEFQYTRGSVSPIQLSSMRFDTGDFRGEWHEGKKIAPNSPDIPDELKQLIIGISKNSKTKDKYEISILRERCIFVAQIHRASKEGTSSSIFGVTPGQPYMDEIRKIIYVPGLRGNPERNYQISPLGAAFPGNFNDYVAGIIYDWQRAKSAKLDDLGTFLRLLGLSWKVSAKKIDDTSVEILIGRLPAPKQGGARDMVSIADVGFGVSQTLPVLVALLVAQRNQLVFVEQPEIHLHPRAQIAFAQIVVNAIRRGVRVVMETHSSLLLLAIQTCIAKGELSANDVSMNWFTRDDTGQTIVIKAEVGDDGSYGDWPVDFGNLELELQAKYIDAAELRAGD